MPDPSGESSKPAGCCSRRLWSARMDKPCRSRSAWIPWNSRAMHDALGRPRYLGPQTAAGPGRWKDRLEEELRDSDAGLRGDHRAPWWKRSCENGSRMLEAFFRDTITPLAFLDRHFNFVRVNEAYARAAGKSPEYFVGKNHFALYPHEENQAIFEQTVRTPAALSCLRQTVHLSRSARTGSDLLGLAAHAAVRRAGTRAVSGVESR